MPVVAFLAPGVLTGASAARNRAWVEDIAFLADRLENEHRDLFQLVDEEDFNGAVAGLIASVPSMNNNEIMLGVARLLAMAHDGHTWLAPWMTTASGGCGFQTYPITGYWFPDGLYVVGGEQGLEQTYGCRVTMIGKTNINDPLAMVEPLISAENGQWIKEMSPYYLFTPEVLAAVGIVSNPRAARFTFEDPKGVHFSLVLEPVSPVTARRFREEPGGPLPLYRTHSGEPNWLAYLEASHTLYFRHARCTDVNSLVLEMRDILNTRPVNKVVVDLRDNSGGVPSQFLVDTLRLYGRAVEGRLFCIIGRRTVSGGIVTAIWLKERAGAILVGEPTGGRSSPIGNAKWFRLPNSGLMVSASDSVITFTRPEKPSLEPDIPVEITAAEYFAGYDPALESILAFGNE